MILILAHHYDKEAVWLAKSLGGFLPEGFPGWSPGEPPGGPSGNAVERPAGKLPEHQMDTRPERIPEGYPGSSPDGVTGVAAERAAGSRAEAFLLIPEALGVDYDVTLRLSDREILATLQPLQGGLEFPVQGTERSALQIKDGCGSQELPGGWEFSSPDISFLVNRLNYIDPLVWKKAGETDRAYATGEINAFFAAFIHAFSCPVVNPVVNGALPESSSANYSLLMALRKRGVSIHPALFQEDGEAFHTMISNLNDCTRMMTFGENILAAPRKTCPGEVFPTEMVKKNLLEALKATALPERAGDTFISQEFFFREAEGKPGLIYISRTPAYSVYAEEFLPLFLRILKNPSA